MKGNNCRKNTDKKQIKAGSDHGRSFVPMVVCRASGESSWRFLFLNRYRTGSKTGGQLPGLVFPDGVKNHVSESKKIRPVSLQRTHALIIKNQRKVKRWQRFVASDGSVRKRRGNLKYPPSFKRYSVIGIR
jgi:hypothetical protein